MEGPKTNLKGILSIAGAEGARAKLLSFMWSVQRYVVARCQKMVKAIKLDCI